MTPRDRPPVVSKTRPLGSQDPRKYSQLIQGLGQTFRWSRAIQCPCRLNTETEQWNPNCETCKGVGWRYVHPNAETERHSSRDYIEVKAAFGPANLDWDPHQPFGPFTFGTATLTVEGSMRVGFYDRFAGVEQEMVWSERLYRLDGEFVPVGKWPRTTAAQLGVMRYEPVRVNVVIDEDDVQYHNHVDFDVVRGNENEPVRMRWNAGLGPAVGKRYSIHYIARPVWIVDSSPYAVQHLRGPKEQIKGRRVVQNLPVTFSAKLDFITFKEGS